MYFKVKYISMKKYDKDQEIENIVNDLINLKLID